MSDERPLSEAMLAIVELVDALGAAPMNQYEGCWSHQVDERWFIAVNGHREPKEFRSPSPTAMEVSRDLWPRIWPSITVPPFSCYVEFNGWPAGLFDAFGGGFAAGELVNEQTFIAAVKAATEKVKAQAAEGSHG